MTEKVEVAFGLAFIQLINVVSGITIKNERALQPDRTFLDFRASKPIDFMPFRNVNRHILKPLNCKMFGLVALYKKSSV